MKLAIAFLSVALCVGCTTYRYSTLSSALPKDSDGSFFYEDDSLKISWSFKGPACPVTVNILNKTSRPLFIDWSKSVLVVNGETRNYEPSSSRVSAESYSTEFKWSNKVASTVGYKHGTITKDENVSFVPPKACAVSQPVQIYNLGSGVNKAPVSDAKYYTDLTTPLRVKSYLTIRAEETGLEKHVESEFWLSKTMRSGANPTSFYSQGNKDSFYTTAVSAVGVIVLIGLCVGAIYLKMDESSSSK